MKQIPDNVAKYFGPINDNIIIVDIKDRLTTILKKVTVKITEIVVVNLEILSDFFVKTISFVSGRFNNLLIFEEFLKNLS